MMFHAPFQVNGSHVRAPVSAELAWQAEVNPNAQLDIPTLKANIVRLANQEWQRWNTGGRKQERDPQIGPTLQDYWKTGVGRHVSLSDLRRSDFQNNNPWSAAFISWVMRKAGSGTAFKYSAAHATYIKAAKDNRLTNSPNPFKAYRLTELRPEVGDLVCKSRANSGATYDNIRAGQKTHCDIVTEVRLGQITTIGGNVNNAVSKKQLPTDARGYLTAPDYFAIIRLTPPGTTPVNPPAPRPSGNTVRPESITYRVDPAQPYGPIWKMTAPPGLPPSARLAGKAGSAIPLIEQLAQGYGLGNVFVAVIKHLAETESYGGRFGLPANIFDARSSPPRPSNKPLITAWGAFQFNRDAWRSLPGVSRTAFPWEATPLEEIARPIRRYSELFREVISAGGSELAAARGVRLWHRTPTGYRKYLRHGRTSGFESAWQNVSASHRNQVDKDLSRAGLLGGAVRPANFPVPPPIPPAPLPATTNVVDRETTPPALTLYAHIDLKAVSTTKDGRTGPKVPPLTGIFVPQGFVARPTVDIVLYLQGHHEGDPYLTIKKYWDSSRKAQRALREELNASGRNAILVAPTLGMRSNAGTLTKPGGLDAYLHQILETLAKQGPYARAGRRPQLGNLILACHSGGGAPMLTLAKSPDQSARLIRECWGFDCMYNQGHDSYWANWAQAHPRTRLYIYYIPGSQTERLSTRLKRMSPPNVSVFPTRRGVVHDFVPITYWKERLQGASFLQDTVP